MGSSRSRGAEGAMAPPGPVKISHKKDGHQRRPHRFHVSCYWWVGWVELGWAGYLIYSFVKWLLVRLHIRLTLTYNMRPGASHLIVVCHQQERFSERFSSHSQWIFLERPVIMGPTALWIWYLWQKSSPSNEFVPNEKNSEFPSEAILPETRARGCGK